MESFGYQLSRYKLLCDMGRRVINTLILRRGDINQIKEILIKKKRVIEEIEKEKEEKKEYLRVWNERKTFIPESMEKKEFENLLDKITCEIKDFLDIEEQLRKLFEALIKKQK
ncbi:MAG: hypothetical protein N2053_00205 [Chitinispirillaceae bacterium]|nr:hypothetical protein [Chitinispirillaceae bacterium]